MPPDAPVAPSVGGAISPDAYVGGTVPPDASDDGQSMTVSVGGTLPADASDDGHSMPALLTSDKAAHSEPQSEFPSPDISTLLLRNE